MTEKRERERETEQAEGETERFRGTSTSMNGKHRLSFSLFLFAFDCGVLPSFCGLIQSLSAAPLPLTCHRCTMKSHALRGRHHLLTVVWCSCCSSSVEFLVGRRMGSNSRASWWGPSSQRCFYKAVPRSPAVVVRRSHGSLWAAVACISPDL
jgi:hypothetical protein